MYQALDHYLMRSVQEAIARRAGQITGTVLPNMKQSGESYVIDEIQARFAPKAYDRFFRVTRPDGTVLYASGTAASFDPTGIPVLKAGAARNFFRKVELSDGSRILIYTAAYQASPNQTFLVESGASLQQIETLLHHLLMSLAIGLPVVVLVAIAGGYALVRRALGPVAQIAESAERITSHHLDQRLPISKTGDELEQLSQALNRMIDRLYEALEQNRRFLADASHELRTPFTVLRGELESVIELARYSPDIRDRVGSALEEVERLAKIVEALFAIGRLDAGEAQAEWARFDLAKLAATTADQMSLLAEDKNISVSCDVQQNVCVEGDASRIKQIVVNLLDNAIKYTPPGGSVKLNVRTVGQKAVLEVVDTGIGIPASAIPHVFERFFRADKARSREVGGAGLGLAIVKSICTAHGGTITVDSVEGCGSRFKMGLPLALPAMSASNNKSIYEH
jgi:heavy metal sensor kinase